jgi:Flp pilus assembly protein TadB
MAQTKRKRRTKHRGNAAGSIESRGRTGRKPTAEEQKKSARQTARDRRVARPPSWNSAALKSSAMAVLLFALTQFHVLSKNTTLSQGLVLSIFALVLYTPLAYMTDRWVYERQQKKLKQG